MGCCTRYRRCRIRVARVGCVTRLPGSWPSRSAILAGASSVTAIADWLHDLDVRTRNGPAAPRRRPSASAVRIGLQHRHRPGPGHRQREVQRNPGVRAALDAVEQVLGSLKRPDLRRRRTPYPGQPRRRDRQARRSPVYLGQGQPADAVRPAQDLALGADPGRAPDPRPRPVSTGTAVRPSWSHMDMLRCRCCGPQGGGLNMDRPPIATLRGVFTR